MTLDPNGPIYKAAIALGYSNPDAMSEGQLERAALAASGALPPPPISPFTQETDDFKARAIADAADRAFAVTLATKVAAAMKATFASFQTANDVRFQHIIANLTALVPGPPDTAGDMEYDRLSSLLESLHLYLAAVTPGWTGNIGQPNHLTQADLLAHLKSVYPFTDAAVNA